MKDARRFQLDELTLRPGTYFNPSTEVMVIVDDSPEVDHEIFESEDFDSADWVLISDESPVDEGKRDDLIEEFRSTYQPGGEALDDGDDVEDDEDELEPDELEELEAE
ncbi:MAG TPA: hypothetical protein VL988_10735 [Solirubrobacteraceae bacterium]|jgi:hypothetical protein|nr:hypothetical protein [Solirubrobacteraceae bacterium]